MGYFVGDLPSDVSRCQPWCESLMRGERSTSRVALVGLMVVRQRRGGDRDSCRLNVLNVFWAYYGLRGRPDSEELQLLPV